MYEKLSLINQIAGVIKKTEFENLSENAIYYVKLHILDTLAASLIGWNSEATRIALEISRRWWRKKEATVFVLGKKVPVDCAGFINSVMARAYDYEPILGGGVTHVPGSIVPAAFALAEYASNVAKKQISGEKLITSIALGLDLVYRIRVAGGKGTAMGSGWLAETFVPFGIVAAGAKILDFDEDQICNALALAYYQCAGNYGATIGNNAGSLIPIGQGLATSHGIRSIIMASYGIKGAKRDIFTGKWGIFALYGHGRYDKKSLLDFARNGEILKPVVKKYPGCGAIQSAIDGTLTLIKQYFISWDKVCSVWIKTSKLNYEQVVKNRKYPQFPSDALWNLRFLVAMAIAKGAVTPFHINHNTLKDPLVCRLYKRIRVVPHDGYQVGESEVHITTVDGGHFKIRCCHPVSELESVVMRKLEDGVTASFSKSEVRNRLNEIKEKITRLELCGDVADEVIPLLKRRGKKA